MFRAHVRGLRNGQQSIQTTPKNYQPSLISKQCKEIPPRPAFQSVCGLASDLSVQITISNRRSNFDEVVLYKDDEDRFTQR